MSVQDTDIRLRKYFDGEIRRFMRQFARVGETFNNEAKLEGTYNDVTGNLRSSIGYAIGLNGEITANDQGGVTKNGEKGNQTGNQYGEQLIAEEPDNGLTLVGFAGMEYAGDVENRKRDVITVATKRAMRRLKSIFKGK